MDKEKMSEFTPAFVQAYEDALRKAGEEAEKMRDLAACLPKDVPPPERAAPSGYCADLSMTFELSGLPEDELKPLVARLLDAYPPMPLVDLPQVRAQKPVAYLRDNEVAAAQHELYPVVFQYEAPRPSALKSDPPRVKARWWTQLPVGVVEIQARGASPSAYAIPAEAFEPDSHTYATGSQAMYRRRLLEVPLGSPPGLEPWLAPLDAFSATLRSPGARMVVNSVKARLFSHMTPVVTTGMLTQTLRVLHNPYERLQPAKYLNEQEAQALVDLAKATESSLREGLPKARAAVTSVVEQASQWLTDVLTSYSGIADNDFAVRVLQQRLSTDIGQGVHLAWLKFDSSTKAFEFRVEVSLGRLAQPVFKDVRFPANPQGVVMTARKLGPVYVPTSEALAEPVA